MSWFLLLVLPVVVLIVVAGAVMIVALMRARPADVPAVMWASSSVLFHIADRLPRASPPAPDLGRKRIGSEHGGVHGGVHGEGEAL